MTPQHQQLAARPSAPADTSALTFAGVTVETDGAAGGVVSPA